MLVVTTTIRNSFHWNGCACEKAVDPLIKALKDEDSDVRWSATEALERTSKKLKKRIIIKDQKILIQDY